MEEVMKDDWLFATSVDREESSRKDDNARPPRVRLHAFMAWSVVDKRKQVERLM